MAGENKTNLVVGRIKRGAVYKTFEVVIKLYRLYGDADILEGIQRLPFEIISSVGNLLYIEKVKKLGVHFLKHKSLRGDIT